MSVIWAFPNVCSLTDSLFFCLIFNISYWNRHLLLGIFLPSSSCIFSREFPPPQNSPTHPPTHTHPFWLFWLYLIGSGQDLDLSLINESPAKIFDLGTREIIRSLSPFASERYATWKLLSVLCLARY